MCATTACAAHGVPVPHLVAFDTLGRASPEAPAKISGVIAAARVRVRPSRVTTIVWEMVALDGTREAETVRGQVRAA